MGTSLTVPIIDHVLFFGLDYKVCEKAFLKAWKKGFIESDPILKGGIRYVLKYMDKQYMSKRNWIDLHGESFERPFMRHSIRFGHSFILDNLDFILAHNYSYRTRHNVLRPLPMYFKNKLLVKAKTNTDVIELEMFKSKIIPEGSLSTYGYSKFQIADFKQRKAYLRECALISASRRSGYACPEPIDTGQNWKGYTFNDLVPLALGSKTLIDGEIIPF